ncbi:MAG: isoprenylcysteine carboxylmethyltransferase family protein [Candidatus Elarobacter sp.]
MFALKLMAGVIVNVLIFAVPLFVLAGTLDWWRAWVIVGVMFAGTVWSVVSLPRDLLEERMKPPVQEGQPVSDRVLLILLLVTFGGVLVVTPLDVFRLHLLPTPDALVSSFGLGLFGLGFWIAYLALRENAFAAPVVKHQEERQQTVIASGVYRVVRHPLYAGGLLLTIGLPLWLESYAGALSTLAPIATIVARIVLEERFLRRALPGYAPYAQRVRYRLIPRLW